MNVWLIVIGSSVAVAVLRITFIAADHWIPASSWVDRASSVLAPALTAALLAPRILAPEGMPQIGPDAVALAFTVPIALRTRSVSLTLATGMPLVWVLRALW
jgi:branched-subunit amino acid transport protein